MAARAVLLLLAAIAVCPTTAAPTTAAPTPPPAPPCEPHAILYGRHCVCPRGQGCTGPRCQEGTVSGDASAVVYGYPTDCAACGCTVLPASLPPTPAGTNGSSIQHVQPREAQATGAPSGECTTPVAFLKLHKVGGTSLAMTLERLAGNGCRLCPRGRRPLARSGPCHIWQTHDTEALFVQDGLRALLRVVPKATTVVLLRDPADRLLSRYFYNLALGQGGLSLAPSDGRNGTARLIPTVPAFRAWLNALPEHELHQYAHVLGQNASSFLASRNLRLFDVVGLTEQFEETMALLALKLGVAPETLTFKREKVVLGRPELNELPKAIQTMLLAAVESEARIYNQARALFKAQIRQTPGFPEALQRLRAAQAKVAQGCTFRKTQSAVNTGHDCYWLGGAKAGALG